MARGRGWPLAGRPPSARPGCCARCTGERPARLATGPQSLLWTEGSCSQGRARSAKSSQRDRPPGPRTGLCGHCRSAWHIPAGTALEACCVQASPSAGRAGGARCSGGRTCTCPSRGARPGRMAEGPYVGGGGGRVAVPCQGAAHSAGRVTICGTPTRVPGQGLRRRDLGGEASAAGRRGSLDRDGV